MSPPGGDEPSSPDTSRSGALANVFRGLTSSKSNRSLPLSSSSSSVALPVADTAHAISTNNSSRGPNHAMDSFDLLKNGAPNERIAAAHTLKYAISEYPLHPVLDIWYAAKDLIEPTKPPAARIAGWELLTECVKHGSSTDLERKEYFQTLAAPASSEDFHLQLAALVDLTQSGRVLDGFDYDLLPLLTRWLSEAYEAVRNARRDASSTARGSRSSSTRSRTAVLGEEKNFAQLFSFIMDVIKFSFKNADEVSLARMIDGLLDICMSTSVEDDLRVCISVLDAIVTFGSIPNDKLKGCVQVLSSIYCLVPALQKDAWRTLSNFFKSHNGQATVRILLDVLRGLTPESSKDRDMTREIRGALAVLRNLLSKSSEEGYPAVPYALLADGLSAAVEATNSSKVYLALLQVVNSLFEDVAGGLHHLVVDEDWSSVLAVATQCAQKTNVDPEKTRTGSYFAGDRSEDPIVLELVQLVTRLEEVITQKTKDYLPRQTIIRFFVSVHSLLPDSTACAVLDYFQEFRCCSPADLEWEDNLDLVLVAFFGNRERSSQTRLKALRTIMDAYEILDLIAEDAERDSVPKLAKSVLKEVTDESDVLVLEAVISLMVSIVSSCEEDLFDHVLGALRGVVDNDRLQSPVSAPVMGGVAFGERGKSNPLPGQSPSNVVTKGYVQMFVAVMNSDGVKSQKLYNALLQIARSPQSEQDARLTAMKLLFRIRADWANKIYLTKELETNFLAPILCRTEASLAKKQANEAAGTLRTSRSDHGGLTRSSRGISFSQGQVSDKAKHGSNSKPTASSYRQLWALPDPDAIPGDIPKLISQFLVSHKAGGEGEDESEDDQNTSTYVLDMPAWLECVLAMLRGSDWEIYSFVLVHLPSQLSNHAVFKDALRQVQDLRKHICEQVRSNSFNEPPNTSGLRRADVAICLFHSLTMILSYHDNFKKSEEDDIVKTFVHGISAWERTAPCCIHGLTICCHELPLSVSKSLGQMLNQMAAIITQPHVSIHILEFLACLSKLHDVYVNFREDEYRTVFGICFRYLESARDKRRAPKAPASSEPTTPAGGSGVGVDLAHPNAADDLPQYVYALGYHVILFWFLALKLPDRATHVGAIARKLFNDVDGSGTMGEEQALIAIDFMQRVTYADINESGEDPKFTSQRMGELVTKRWLVGNSIVAIKQSTRTGWAEVTKRQPSGTSTYMVREALRPAPLHQTGNQPEFGRDGQVPTNVVLPSHLMIQLMSSIPQSCDVARPIILPDDEATDRMLRVMDRNPTVDGHKVGVIYIGEGQTDEVEILSNVSGSSDYHEFLNKLGTLVKLKGAKFNTQGLDREMDIDGEYAYAWRDRLTEIVFHVTTQMPTNLQHDPQLSMKKRHIGNDFVNIIYNDSGLPFKFDTFPSQFNYVYIVITPASRASFIAAREARRAEHKEQPFYRVQVMSKPGFPEISPASEVKMVSLKALPEFIRLVALNASVFSLVWQARGGEYVSSWRARLREIKRLREKYAPKAAMHSHSAHHLSPSPPPNASGGGSGAAQQYPQLQAQQAQQVADSSRPSSSVRDSFTSLRRTSVATFFTSTSEQTSHRSSMLSGSATSADTEVGNSPSGAAQQQSGSDLNADAVDFSKWT